MHAGARSLKLEFDKSKNLTNFGVRQEFYLRPGSYRFRAWVKTQDLNTDQGVSFKVTNDMGRTLFTTEPSLGSTDWKLVEKSFEVPPGAGSSHISLTRIASLRFDDLLAGTLWIDDVSIRPERR